MIFGNRRHRLLMATATAMVREAEVRILADPASIRPDQVVSQVFGRHAMRLTEGEATDYLRAALTLRGHDTAHLPTLAADPARGSSDQLREILG
ncbi:hypothetical protein ACFXPW_33385 [Streptomyces goshikiensis]|uniref:hypothetical protein n=1 Tax=Streptomyces goshikiensis TaxID=1942 RepID=UPI0036804A21